MEEVEKRRYFGGISVIIPFYRNVTWLSNAIESVVDQTAYIDEIIIVDDGSDEDLSFIKQQYPKLIVIHQDNAGAANARNKGIKLSSMKYVAFLDTDDLWHTKKIEIQLKHMLQSKCKWSYTAYTTFHDKEYGEVSLHENPDKGFVVKKLYPKLLLSCDIATPTVIVERETLVKESLGFNEDLKVGEDYCLWIELSKRHEVCYVNTILCSVRMHGSNAAKNVKQQLFARSDVYQYLEGEMPFDIKIPYVICKIKTKIIKVLFQEKQCEILSSILAIVFYILPWLLFKVLFFARKWM